MPTRSDGNGSPAGPRRRTGCAPATMIFWTDFLPFASWRGRRPGALLKCWRGGRWGSGRVRDASGRTAQRHGRVFSELAAGEYPQFGGLVSLLRHGRKSHHRSAGVAEELDLLSSELAKGLRRGSRGFVPGWSTNVDFRGPGLHFDTSACRTGAEGGRRFTIFEHVRRTS